MDEKLGGRATPRHALPFLSFRTGYHTNQKKIIRIKEPQQNLAKQVTLYAVQTQSIVPLLVTVSKDAPTAGCTISADLP